MGWKISKPLGSRNSFVNRAISKPIPTLVGGALMGVPGMAMGAGLSDVNANLKSKTDEIKRQMAAGQNVGQDDLALLAQEEEAKRKALGQQQQKQILAFADEQQGRASEYRKTLADSLASSGKEFFNQMNPAILEDLNSRGLFTSQTARDQEQSRALKDIELANQQQLSAFDTNTYNDINDIRSTGLSALLGGEQSALDSALELRKAGIQRRFDEADAAKKQSYADMLSKRQSRDQLLSSILGLGGSLGAGFLGRA